MTQKKKLADFLNSWQEWWGLGRGGQCMPHWDLLILKSLELQI